MPLEVKIATFPNEMMARYWAEVLKEEGIPSVIKPLYGGYGVFGHISLIPHGLYVLPADEERARQFIDKADQA